MEEKIFLWEAVFMIWSFLAKNYLFKVSNWSTRIRYENCSKEDSRTMSLALYVFTVKCEHVSRLVLTVDFEQASVCWVHIKDRNTFDSKITYIMCYAVVFSLWTRFINKQHVTYTIKNLRVNQSEILAKEFT